MELVTRSIFELPPEMDGDVARAFRAHVAATGEPETFPSISTASLPRSGGVFVVTFPIEVDPAGRKDRLMAPCPLCSPSAPKWLHDGMLLWCEQTRAIYCIGPRCSAGDDLRARIDAATNVYLEKQRDRKDAISLQGEIELIDQRLEWIRSANEAAAIIDRRKLEYVYLPTALRRSLFSAIKGGYGAPGASFLNNQSLKLSAKLAEQSNRLVRHKEMAKAGDADTLAPRIRRARLKELAQINRDLQAVQTQALEAHRFFSEDMADHLVEMQKSGRTALKIRRTGSTCQAATDEAAWRIPIGGLKRLPPPPKAATK